MADKERKPREEIDATKIDLLKPLDIFALGGEDDPCFGKHHDLKAPECQECGDSEFCAIVKAQNLHQERSIIESSQRFKDIESAKDAELKKKSKAIKLIEGYMAKGFPKLKTIITVARETNLTKDIVKELYNKTN